MTPAGHSRLFAAVLMGAASINAAKSQVAFATTQDHDGIYAVDITTRQGDCDKAYHWKISVSGGHISSAGDTPMEASGQISGRGIVHFAFQRVGQVATVTGTLVRGAGSGFVTLAGFTCFYCLPGESPATRFQCLSLASPRSKTASTCSM